MMIPGAREPGMLTTFAAPADAPANPGGRSTMDAGTSAERRREGGGAPRQRRAARRPMASGALPQDAPSR